MSLDRPLAYAEVYEAPVPSNGQVPPPVERRTSWSAAELMLIDFPEPRWAVPGIVAEGITLLAGPPKVGKSWLAMNVGLAVSTGGKAIGRIDVDQGDVLYLALEDTGRRLQNRLRVMLAGAPAPHRLRLATTCEPMHLGGAEKIDAWLERNPDTRLVVIDVLSRVRAQVSVTANRYDSDYAAMSVIKEIADRYGVAVMVVHHTRKASAEDFLDTVSGTQGLAGAADAVLILARSRGAATATLKVTGRDIEEAQHALSFAADIGTWQLLEGEATDYDLSDTRRRILHLLRDEDALTPKAIAERLGIKEPTARQTCRRMVDDGQLDTDGDGHYFPTLSLLSPESPTSDSGDRSDREERPA